MEAFLSHRKYCTSIESFCYSTGWNYCPQTGVKGLTHLPSHSTIFILLFKTVAIENIYIKKSIPFFLLACSTNCMSAPCSSLPCSAGLLERMSAGQGCQSCCAEGPQLTITHYTAIHLGPGVHGCKLCPLLPTAPDYCQSAVLPLLHTPNHTCPSSAWELCRG